MKRTTETITICPEPDYCEITVKLWGKGVVLRGIISGAEIAGSRRFVAKPGQFILSRIDARNGAIGIVPADLEGAVVTNDFPLFDIDHNKLYASFLGWLSKTQDFVELCQRASEGTTNRVRLQEHKFLDLEIHLPPLAEQQRIVARIEELARKIEEARGLRQMVLEEEERLFVAMAHRSDLNHNSKLKSGWKEVAIRDICKLVDQQEPVTASKSYPNFGIYSFGRGVFLKPPIDGTLTSAKSLRRVRAGQFIYSRLFAFEGAYAMVPPEFDNYYVSAEYPTFTCDPTKACAEFLWAYFRSPSVWQTVAEGSKGLGNRRQRVQPDRMLGYRVWLPPIEWQQKIQAVQTKVNALKKLQAETAAEVDALLPSILDKAFKGEL